MTNPPQAQTLRYVNSLLRNGQNHEFVLEQLNVADTIIHQTKVGVHFDVTIVTRNGTAASALGSTPEQAVKRAMESFAVTFR